MVVKKLLVDDKITACVKKIYMYILFLLGVICKAWNRKTLSGEALLLSNACYQFSTFVLQVTSCFLTSC